MEKKSKNKIKNRKDSYSRTNVEGELTPRQAAFAKEYLIDLNATQAAIRAGYSENTAAAQGARLLTIVKIQEYIKKGNQKRIEKVEVNSEEVLRELLRISRADMRTIWNEDGSMKPIHEWDDSIAACVSEVIVEELFEFKQKEDGRGMEKVQIGWVKRVKFWDKNKSLDMLGRHLKLFSDDDKNKGNAMILVENGTVLNRV